MVRCFGLNGKSHCFCSPHDWVLLVAGDCYLAITGVPKPQNDHVVVMTKFAIDCLEKMDHLVHSSALQELGSDTSELKLRVGIHSGNVVAGVLRGERARFQLFGDAVNTGE